MRRGSSVLLFIILLIVAVSFGAVGSLLALTNKTPEALEQATEPSSIPLAKQQYFDEQEISLRVTPGEVLSVRSSRAGKLTVASCDVRVPLVSGKTNFSVDGIPLINLSTTVPLWRDISVGNEGIDVDALRKALTDLGYEMSTSTQLTWSDVSAVNELLKASNGIPHDEIHVSDFVWIPATESYVQSCTASLAEDIESGAELATYTAAPSVSMGQIPKNIEPGDRVLDVDGALIKVTDGNLIGPEDQANILTSASYVAARAQSTSPTDPITLQAKWRLSVPIDAVTVPPSAIRISSANLGCVSAKGSHVPLRVLSSKLGASIVLFESDPPASIESRAPSSCE